MATPQQAPIPSEYEMLSDLYLTLWEQLDLVCGDAKWFDIRPPEASDLAAEARRRMEEIRRRAPDPKVMATVREDYQRTLNLVQSARKAPRAPSPELAAFKDYLRDEGLRYGDTADEE
ncbi:MAG TPA: hypothetical protein VEU62_07290 [Bryobacterales bacterium]|nr:hypothetical protein [Bryobacterales bacterium]